MGFEPTTPGTTIQCSAIELQEPYRAALIVTTHGRPTALARTGVIAPALAGDKDSNPD